MTDWEPMDSPYPDTWEEDAAIRLDGHDGEWTLRRIGSNSWVRVDDATLMLPGLARLGGLFDEPELRTEGTAILVARPPSVYLAVGDGRLGIENITCGTFEVNWYDLEAQRWVRLGERVLDGGDELFEPPPGSGERVALFLRRTSR